MQRESWSETVNHENKALRYQWLTTFNDMITLLMVFFVLLFSMGSLDVKRFKHFQNALQSAMGVLYSGEKAPIGIIAEDDSSATSDMGRHNPQTGQDTDFDQLKQTQGLEAQYTPKGIQLALDERLLFGSGSARLTEGGKVLLKKVAEVVGPLKRMVRVEGHTDNLPISTERYPSNWELSTARAISVVKYLHQTGAIPASRLAAAGYGASRPRADNTSARYRSKNRRVEIILQKQEFLNIE